MENLEQVKEALGEHAQSEAIITAVGGFIEAEKNKGIEAARHKSNETKKQLEKYNGLKGRLTEHGIDVDSDFGDQFKNLGVNGSNEELTALKKENGSLTIKLKESGEAIEAYKASSIKRNESTIRATLKGAFGEAKAINYTDTVDNMINSGEAFVDESGEVVIKSGENTLSFDKERQNIVSSLIDNKRLTLGIDQNGGSGGSSTGGQRNNNKDFRKATDRQSRWDLAKQANKA